MDKTETGTPFATPPPNPGKPSKNCRPLPHRILAG